MEKVIVLINNKKKSNMCSGLKEKLIEEYCKEKGYYIDSQEYIGYLTTFDLVDFITNMISLDVEENIINKVIVISADELTKDYEKLLAISTMLKEFEVEIESITDGVIGKDMTFQLNVDKGDEN